MGKIAYIEITGNHNAGLEGRLLLSYLMNHHPDVNVQMVGNKEVEKLKVKEKPFVVYGGIRFTKLILRKLGMDLPKHNDYPEELSPWFKRNIWSGTKADVTEDNLPVFIKPKERLKLFTGFVCKDVFDEQIKHVSNKTPLWFSEVIPLHDEYRCYVVDGELMYMGSYDTTEAPSSKLRSVAISIASKIKQRDIVFDVAMHQYKGGCLIEVNEAFAVGAYGGVPSDIFGKMIVNYWQSLIVGDKNDHQ